MEKVLSKRSEIYLFSTIWVILFHVARKTNCSIPVLSQVLAAGNSAVDIFLLLSGICVYLSFAKNPKDLKGFFSRRFKRILIPYLIIAVPFCILKAFSFHGGFDVLQFFGDITPYSFITVGTQTTWYAFAIIFFYLLVPLLYKLYNSGVPKIVIWGVLFLPL